MDVRMTALEAFRDTVEGSQKSASYLHNDLLKVIKPLFTDKSAEVRIAACEIVTSMVTYTNNLVLIEGSSGSLALCLKVKKKGQEGVLQII
jgi:hypothetical protein